jgi:hypothetical protein
MWVQGTNLCRVYNCYNSQAHGHERSAILPRLDGIGWFGLHYWFESIGQFFCPLWGTTLVLYGTTTLVLCGTTSPILYGTTTFVLCGTYHPVWLSFSLIDWFCLWLGIGLSSGENTGLWQDHELIIWVEWLTQSIPLVNVLIFELSL